LHVIPDAVKLDSRALLRYLDAHAIHLLDAVPSYMHAVLNEVAPEQPPNGLRYLLIGGEKLEQRLLQAVFGQIGPAVEIVNIYGLTEISDINALGVLRASDLGKPITVGKPLQNNRIYILDQHQQPQPIGIAGEVCVAGASVSRGYLFRPELTAERFVACPFEDGALMVRTGDLGRWRADGTIEILGRIDHQVKIRGFRIEIGEIEAVLCQHEAVHEAVVTLREDTSPASGHPQKRLVAYIEQKNKRTKEQGDEIEAVPTRAPGPVTPDFRAYLKDRLPDYMVPSAFVFLDTLPKTPNGKIDRRALPAPELAAELDECFVAPRNPIEDLLASVWADVLGVERVGTRDNFFELGGHSLLATQIASRVREAFQVELPLHTLFELPTVAELAEQIQRARRSASHLQAPPIVPLAMDEPLPLSFAQQRLWILDQLEPGNVAYNIPAALRLTGPLDVLALDRSLSEIVRRHAVLRSTITATDGVAAQVVDPFFSLLLMPLDLRALPAADRQAEAERLIVEESQQPFDLSFGPLIRCTLLQLDDREHLLLLTLHHIVADGWSLGVLVRELETLYTAFLEGLPAPLPDLPIQYGDYAAWQRQWLQGEVLDRQIDYWKAQLAGVGVLDLPLDHPRPPVRTFRSGRQTLTIERALTDRLAAFNRRQGVTLFMTLLAAFKLLLHRWSGQTDIVVGSPIAGRTRAETEDLIGLFLNTLVLRSDLSGDPGFVELLRRVREVCLQAYAHQDVPFEKLLEELQPERNLSHTPLFQVFFNMLNYPYRHCELPGLQLEVLAPPDIGAKFDLTLYVEERDAGIFCDLVYNADLFSEARMAALLDQFQHLLAQLVAQPETPIGAYTLVTTAARAYLPDPTVALDGGCEGVVHELVVKQARQTPERIALIDPHTRWTYAELETRSNQLAHDLLAHGIRRGECVAIYGHRSAALIWALLGVLKAGAAFTILDPSYPAARLIDYLQVAWPKGWLQLAAAGPSPDALTDYVATLGCRWTLELPRRADELPDRLASRPTSDPDVDVVPDDLAYVAFTSGSTGRPKGILGTHRPLVHFLAWHRDTFGFGAADRFSMLSGLAHDPLLRDIFTPLILGATLCIPDPDALNTPGYLRAWMQQQAVTVSHLTPPLGHLLSIAPHASDASNGAASLPDLRYVFFGGDVLTRHDVERVHLIAPDAQLVNFYGATETPQGIAYYVLPQPQPDMAADAGDQSKAIVPLGRGIADVQLLVLNAARQPAGVGELGEIFVRTSYLARGYSDDTARTDERFIANPFTGCQQGRPAWAPGVPGDRLYRTADLGRYLPDGNVMFAGRADQQVKIRGFRIEPSEVEAAIERHPAVREVAVVAREDVPGEKRLVAYVVPSTAKAGGGALWAWESPMLSSPAPTAAGAEAGGEGRAATRETRELRSFVQSLLPAYMVPSAFVVLDALPLTPNGKLDRRALPRPEDQRSPAARVLPQTELERSIAAIWQEVLHVDRLGVDDNFFDLGGSSVHIVQVHSKLRDLLQRDMPVVELFKYPTVGALAKWLSQGPNARPSFEEIDDRVRKQHEALDWQRQLRADLDE
ncbi:MAG TPA: amino acid adenylation domain-containing protein, partial [Herpetosiphonaceae bacterium]